MITRLSGSSPRMRGTFAGPVKFNPTRRFIPADAGNMFTQFTTPHYAAVHPRGCGEHEPVELDRWSGPGSSPRMRGTSSPHTAHRVARRFIPADAGNIIVCNHGGRGNPVHPRGCGEHLQYHHFAHTKHGSSPRMRGTC